MVVLLGTRGNLLATPDTLKPNQLFSDVICVQEHFQLKNCKYRVSNAFSSDFELFFKPAVKSNTCLEQGRPKGGLFTAWRKNQVKKVTRLAVESFRVQGIILEYKNCNLLLINTYFPCDPQKQVLSDVEAAELHRLLSDIFSMKQLFLVILILMTIDILDIRKQLTAFLTLKDWKQFGISFQLTSHLHLHLRFLQLTISLFPTHRQILYWRLG